MELVQYSDEMLVAVLCSPDSCELQQTHVANGCQCLHPELTRILSAN